MKRYLEIMFAALVFCTAVLSATQVYAKDKHNHRGRNAAIGIVGAAAALAIIGNSAARADDRRSDRRDYDDDEGQCHRWDNRCRDGADWACRKFDRNC
jgi:hypothetical protein